MPILEELLNASFNECLDRSLQEVLNKYKDRAYYKDAEQKAKVLLSVKKYYKGASQLP